MICTIWPVVVWSGILISSLIVAMSAISSQEDMLYHVHITHLWQDSTHLCVSFICCILPPAWAWQSSTLISLFAIIICREFKRVKLIVCSCFPLTGVLIIWNSSTPTFFPDVVQGLSFKSCYVTPRVITERWSWFFPDLLDFVALKSEIVVQG